MFRLEVGDVLFRFVLLVNIIAVVKSCPRACFCNTISKIVYCSRKNLEVIPKGIPKNTKQLNFNENSFEVATLKRQNFSEFRELEHLYLSACGIRAIEVGTFIDLQNLKWLDLSKNNIKDLQDFTFRGLTLEHLFVNGNEGLNINQDTFTGLNVQGLYLQRCGLQTVSYRAFQAVNGSLTKLWLNNNNIRKLPSNFEHLFSSLKHLRLHSNPFHCNCRLKWLKNFYDKKKNIFEGTHSPGCITPSYTNHRGFNKLTVADFRCEPPIFNNVDLLFSNKNGVLSCSASGDPAPYLYWVKPSGERLGFIPDSRDEAGRTDAEMMISYIQGKVHAGSYACVALNDGGNVTLTLNVSWPKIQQASVVRYIKEDTSPTAMSSTPKAETDLSKDNSEVFTMQHNNILNQTFSVVELAGAIIATFIITLLICVIAFHITNRCRARHSKRDILENPYSVAPCIPKHEVYLDTKADEGIYMGIDELPAR